MTHPPDAGRIGKPIAAALAVMLAAFVVGTTIDAYAPLVTDAATVFKIAGSGGQQRYLVLAQNPAELRPTGGYIGTVGLVTFDRFRPQDLSFTDVYQYDLRPNVPFVEPPEALQNSLLGTHSWQLADAGWSADFPTSAWTALQLYTLESGDSNIDGVIGLNTYAVDDLLEATGPIDVPEYGVTVAAGETTLKALSLTRPGPDLSSTRKDFLGVLANRVLDAVETLPPARFPRLVTAFRALTESRDMMVWFTDPEEQQAIASQPIAGAVRDGAGDYLMVVEANVAPTSKYNLVIDRSDSLDVTLDDAGNASSALDLTWQNNAMNAGEPYESIRQYSTSEEGIYGAYVRVLTPAASQLGNVEGMSLDEITGPDETGSEAGRNSVGNSLLMAPGESTMSYEWMTPGVASQSNGLWTYHLTVQKQPGLRPMPVSLRLTLPTGARVVSAPGAAAIEANVVTLSERIDRDIDVDVSYRL